MRTRRFSSEEKKSHAMSVSVPLQKLGRMGRAGKGRDREKGRKKYAIKGGDKIAT